MGPGRRALAALVPWDSGPVPVDARGGSVVAVHGLLAAAPTLRVHLQHVRVAVALVERDALVQLRVAHVVEAAARRHARREVGHRVEHVPRVHADSEHLRLRVRRVVGRNWGSRDGGVGRRKGHEGSAGGGPAVVLVPNGVQHVHHVSRADHVVAALLAAQ